MTLISDLQKTIAILTAKLEQYEMRDALNQNKNGEMPTLQTPVAAQGFSVNFGGTTTGLDFGSDQGRSYRSILLTDDQPKNQPTVPQPGSAASASASTGTSRSEKTGKVKLDKLSKHKQHGYDPIRSCNIYITF